MVQGVKILSNGALHCVGKLRCVEGSCVEGSVIVGKLHSIFAVVGVIVY